MHLAVILDGPTRLDTARIFPSLKRRGSISHVTAPERDLELSTGFMLNIGGTYRLAVEDEPARLPSCLDILETMLNHGTACGVLAGVSPMPDGIWVVSGSSSLVLFSSLLGIIPKHASCSLLIRTQDSISTNLIFFSDNGYQKVSSVLAKG